MIAIVILIFTGVLPLVILRRILKDRKEYFEYYGKK